MISVVIPSYNRSTLLKRAVDSVLAQTFPGSEVIVVDDGSTDDTKDVCARFSSKIEYVWQKNAGASVARNTGVNHARNPWVAFLDSDDYWAPSHLARMTRAIEATGGEAGFYFSDMQMSEHASEKTLWQLGNFSPPKPIHMTSDGTNWAFLRWQPMILQSSVFRKDVWVTNGGLDPKFRLMHDPDLFFRLSIGEKICAVSGVGCVYTDDDASNLRLTAAVDPREPAYWRECIALWQGVRRRFPNLSRQYQRVVQSGLAAAHWRLFRLYWSSRNLGKSAWHLSLVGWADLRFALSILAHTRDANSPVVFPEY